MTRDELKQTILKWIGMCYGSQEMEDPCYNIDALADFLYVKMIHEEEKRYCKICGKEMKEGYYNEDTMEYYCSENCLHHDYSEEEYLDLYDDGNGDFYWTTWEEE